MASNQSNTAGCGLGFLAILLTVLFVALKLTGVIAWPWLAVISPFLIYIALAIVWSVVVLVFIVIVAIAAGSTKNKVRRYGRNF